MRSAIPILLFAALSLACKAILPRATAEPPSAPLASSGVIIPQDDDDAWPPRPDDPEARKRHMAERFPGVKALDLVKVVSWVEPRRAICWSELLPPERSTIRVDYRARKGPEQSARSFDDLVARGWTKVYRTPHGEGFELRDELRSVDLTLETEFRCHCAPASEIVEGSRHSLRLRFRWNEGEMPQVSAVATRQESDRPHAKPSGLVPSVTFGTMATYDFLVQDTFPGQAPGTCGAHLLLGLVVDPPIL